MFVLDPASRTIQPEMKTKPKMGRPRKEIDQKTFEGLCEIQCTLTEIASVFRVSVDTIERWCKRTYEETFAESYKKFMETGKTSLRRLQWRHAQTNPAMAIFLGKNYLGQSDKLTLSDADIDAEIERRLANMATRSQDSVAGEAESEAIN